MGVHDIILATLCLGLMFSIQWRLALLSLLPFVAMLPLMLRAAGHFANAGYERQTQKGLMMSAVQEGIVALPLTKSFGIQRFIRDCFGDELKKLEDKNTDGY